MKICYLANAASIHTVRWARHFAGQGHDITVISFQYGEIERVRSICLTPHTSVSRIQILSLIPQVRRLVRQIKPHILHAHYITSYGLAGALSGWHPFVATAWGDDVLISPEESNLYRMMVKWTLSRADLVTSMAGHMTDLMKERGYASANKILTLPFGVDTRCFNPACRRNRSGVGNINVISTRHLMAEYDVQTLVKAIPLVLLEYPTARFIIAGNGDQRSTLEAMARQQGIGEYVHFVGFVSHEEMPHLLGNADMFVSTSTTDGNNISLNEAMACGVFPIVSDIPANREWVVEGQNGLFFPVGDIQHLAESMIHAMRLRDSWKAFADKNWMIIEERGSWLVNMAIMEARYQRILKSKGLTA